MGDAFSDKLGTILGLFLALAPILIFFGPPILILIVLRVRVARRIREWHRPEIALPPVEPVVEDSNPYRVVDV